MPETLIDLFRRGFREHRKRDAFLHKTGGQYRPVSSEEAETRVLRLAAALLDAGIRPGDRVGLLSESRLEWALADLAILSAGAASVPLFPNLSEAQIECLLGDSEAALVFCSGPACFSRLQGAWPRLRALRSVVIFDGAPPPHPTPGRVVPLAEFEAAGARRLDREPALVEERAASVAPDHLASIIYTSGTTGDPKGVMLTHRNFVSNVRQTLEVVDVGPQDVTLSHLPLAHVFERMAGLFTPIAAGATIAYAESFEMMGHNLPEVRPSIVMSVPRFFDRLLARAAHAAGEAGPVARAVFVRARAIGAAWSRARMTGAPAPWLEIARAAADRLVYHKLRAALGGRIRYFFSGAAPLHSDVARFFHAAGLPVLEGYGLTETSPVISVNTLRHWKIGTVGPPVPGVEVRIAADGEIMARGPNVMRGYYRRPEDTATVIDGEGWLHTGDIGTLDTDGFLSIADRKKDLIVTAGGKNVAPQPIEMLLRSIPYVSEAVLVGDRRPYLAALVVPNFPALEEYARAAHIAFGSRAELVSDRRIRALIRREIEARSKALSAWEKVRRFAILDRELTIGDDEITPTLKVKRQRIAVRWAELIDSLYDG